MKRVVPNCVIAEDERKTFSKRILQPGIGDVQPGIGYEARVMINFIGKSTFLALLFHAS